MEATKLEKQLLQGYEQQLGNIIQQLGKVIEGVDIITNDEPSEILKRGNNGRRLQYLAARIASAKGELLLVQKTLRDDVVSKYE